MKSYARAWMSFIFWDDHIGAGLTIESYEKILLTSIIRRNQYMIESKCICLTKILSYLNNGSRKDIYLILSSLYMAENNT
jgi:hypothetical protein